MKKIINGRRYDTTTAELMGEASYSHSGDFESWFEELYRKKTGEFFLYGGGGPRSRYVIQTSQNNWSGSEEIRPLTLEEAQEWAEKHLKGDEYEEIFGVVEEDKEQVSTWLLATVKAEGDKLREEKDLTWADIVEAGIKTLWDCGKQNV